MRKIYQNFRQISLVFGLILFTSNAQALDCTPTPDCGSLGYTKTEADCQEADVVLKCPHDQSKMFCLSQEEIDGNTAPKVGDILYSDKTLSKELIETKTPIGVVFDEENRLAVALDQKSLSWSMDDYYDSSSGTRISIDVPGLDNCSEFAAITTCSTNGKQNTAAIIAYVTSTGKTGKYPAAEYCASYKPSTVQVADWYAEGQWFLPSMKELETLSSNYEVVSAYLQKAGGVGLPSYYSWSSNEIDDANAWVKALNRGSSLSHSKSSSYDRYVRPVIAF